MSWRTRSDGREAGVGPSGSAAAASTRCLVIDDEQELARIVADYLAREGFVVSASGMSPFSGDGCCGLAWLGWLSEGFPPSGWTGYEVPPGHVTAPDQRGLIGA